MTKKEKKQRDLIIAEALSWMNTPFHWHGRVKGCGVDCGTYILEVFERAKLTDHINIPNYSVNFAMHRSDEWYKKIIEQYCVPVLDREPLPGDIAIFKFGRSFSHGSIVYEWPIVISSLTDQGVAFADANKELLGNRERLIYSFWR